MATGALTYAGLAVPLLGESNIIQQTAATDILTITGASAQSGKSLVIRNSSQTELFSVDSTGLITSAVGIAATTTLAAASETLTGTAAGTVGLAILRASTPSSDALRITANDGSVSANKAFRVTKNYNMLSRVYTCRPTTALTKGELMVLFHNSTPKIGICISTAGQQIKLIRLKTKTFGRLTA